MMVKLIHKLRSFIAKRVLKYGHKFIIGSPKDYSKYIKYNHLAFKIQGKSPYGPWVYKKPYHISIIE